MELAAAWRAEASEPLNPTVREVPVLRLRYALSVSASVMFMAPLIVPLTEYPTQPKRMLRFEFSSNVAHETMSRAIASASWLMLPELSTQKTRSTTDFSSSPWLSAVFVTRMPFGFPSTSTQTFWPSFPVPMSLNQS